MVLHWCIHQLAEIDCPALAIYQGHQNCLCKIWNTVSIKLVFTHVFPFKLILLLANSAVAEAIIPSYKQGYKSTSSSVEYPVTLAHRQKDITMPKIWGGKREKETIMNKNKIYLKTIFFSLQCVLYEVSNCQSFESCVCIEIFFFSPQTICEVSKILKNIYRRKVIVFVLTIILFPLLI